MLLNHEKRLSVLELKSQQRRQESEGKKTIFILPIFNAMQLAFTYEKLNSRQTESDLWREEGNKFNEAYN